MAATEQLSRAGDAGRAERKDDKRPGKRQQLRVQRRHVAPHHKLGQTARQRLERRVVVWADDGDHLARERRRAGEPAL
eukprot:scaffold6643_cov133-Isochrysis_galbana.AAC.5